MMKTTILLLAALFLGSNAFATLPVSRSTTTTTSTSSLNLVEASQVADVGFTVNVKKPIGVVFGENNQPYGGLRVDEVELGTEGSRVGLRVGDQLMAINGDVVIGEGFDYTMGMLKSSPAKLKLMLYRGSVRDLYTILNKRGLEVGEDDDSEVVVMDENYESPVRVEVVEDKGFDFGLAMSRLMGGGKKETAVDGEEGEYQEEVSEEDAPVVEKSGGFFGLFKQETIQLEGDDAKGTK